MNWIYIHLAGVMVSALSGLWVFVMPKGTARHRLIGRVYVGAMLLASLSSFMLPASVGPQLLLHFGFIHLLSLFVLLSVPYAIVAIKRGNTRLHRGLMVGNYMGGIVIAGGFAIFLPGRLLHQLVF